MKTVCSRVLVFLAAFSAVCGIVFALIGAMLPAVFAGFVAMFFGACLVEEKNSEK